MSFKKAHSIFICVSNIGTVIKHEVAHELVQRTVIKHEVAHELVQRTICFLLNIAIYESISLADR